MTEKYGWDWAMGEDPDDRRIREAHGFGYDDPDEAVCRQCGRTYGDVSASKSRSCMPPDNTPGA